MRSDMQCTNNHNWHHHGQYIHAGSSNHAGGACCHGPAIAIVAEEKSPTR